MASSFITMDDTHGFWIRDSLMQVVCWGLVIVIDEIPDDDFWAKGTFREHIFNNSQGIFVGFMHLLLDEYLITQKRKIDFCQIILNTKRFFLNKGDFIAIKELNDFQMIRDTKATWQSPLETSRVIKILSFLQDVVNNEIGDEKEYEF